MSVLVTGLQSTRATPAPGPVQARTRPPIPGPQRVPGIGAHPGWETLALEGPPRGASREVDASRVLGDSAAGLERELERVRPELVAFFGVDTDLRGHPGLHELGHSATLFESELAHVLGNGPCAHPALLRGLITLGSRLSAPKQELVPASQALPVVRPLLDWANSMNACVLFVHLPLSAMALEANASVVSMIERIEESLKTDSLDTQDWKLPEIS
jgi:hypothetical protein